MPGDAELLEVSLSGEATAEVCMAAMNRVLPPALQVSRVRMVADRFPKVSAALRQAEYRITLTGGGACLVAMAIPTFLDQDEIMALRKTNRAEIVRTGTPVNSAVNLEVLGTIFYEGTPLHDGAAIIENGRIKAAGCVLPLSNNLDLGKDMGTRHRACLGIAENSDAIAVVVSEETGIISMAKNGVLIRHFDRQTLYTRLVDEMIPKETASEKAAADGWRGKVKSLLNWMNQKEEDEQQ